MHTTEQAARALAGVDDETLFAAGNAELQQKGYASLNGLSFDGIAIRVPARADLRARNRLPVLVAIEQNGERDAEVPLGRNAAVVVIEPESGGHWATALDRIPPGKIPVPPGRKPPPPVPDASETSRSQAIIFLDLWAGGELPRRPGRYAVQATSWDWKSNVETVEVVDGDKPLPAGPSRAAKVKGEAGDPAALPFYGATPENIDLKSAGAALAVPGQPVKEGSAIPVYGSLRLKENPAWPRTENKLPAIPVCILVARPGIPIPLAADLDVPVLDPIAGGEARAHFAVDLARALPQPLPPGRYQVYLAAGGLLAGPYPLSIVE